MARSIIPEKLNICLLANRFPRLGQATDFGFIWPIAKELAKKHNVTVLSWKNPRGQTDVLKNNVRAYFLGNKSKSLQFPEAAFEKFKELHSKDPFHIVHSIDSSGILIGQNKKNFNVSMVYNVEATGMSQIFSIMALSQKTTASMVGTGLAATYVYLKTYLGHDRKVLNNADGVFVSTPKQEMALERHYFYPPVKTFSVPFGIELGDLSPQDKSKDLLEKLNINESSPIAVTFTEMNELSVMKNILRAFEQVVIKKPSARLVVVGDGPMKRDVEYEMLSLALGSKVKLVGHIKTSEVTDYISLADVFINLNSQSSGFDPSLLEAMAQQTPIIASDSSPIATIVDDGTDGFLIRPGDTQFLSQLMLNILSKELPVSHIGRAAREKVLNIFDTEKMVKKTLSGYKKALVSSGQYKRP